MFSRILTVILSMPAALRRPGFLHDLAVSLFIEWRTAGRKLPQRMVLLPHQIRTERQRLAHAPLVEVASADASRSAGGIRARQRGYALASSTRGITPPSYWPPLDRTAWDCRAGSPRR